MNFLRRLFDRQRLSSQVAIEPPVSLERLTQMLEYARRRDVCGRGKRTDDDRWVGRFISLETTERRFLAQANNPYYAENTMVIQYPSVKWSYTPHHLGVYLIGGVVEFRASHDGVPRRESMPLATSPEDLREIRRCFDFWYEEFGLPESLSGPINPPRIFEPTGNAMQDIDAYLKDGSNQSFHDLFEEDGPVIWVDWGEEDDNIIRMAAAILPPSDLKADFDDDSCDLLISYHGTVHRIRYPEEGIADRDTTIIALNRILQPGYELRLCNASRGSDTLALLLLSASDWAAVEHQHPLKSAESFTKINEGSEIFDRSA